MSLHYKKIYTFTELVSLKIPRKRNGLLSLIGHFDELLNLWTLYDSQCVQSQTKIPDFQCTTFPLSFFVMNDMTHGTTMAPKKRKCSLSICQ